MNIKPLIQNCYLVRIKGVILFLTLILTGCEKELDFKYHEVESPLVLEATLTYEGAYVMITHTTPMNEAMDLTPVTDATVILTDITTGNIRKLPIKDNGSFGDDIPGESGHEYQVEVSTGGSNFLSKCLMYKETEIVDLSFQWIKMPYDYVAALQVSFKEIPGEKETNFWVRILRNGDPYKWSVVANRKSGTGTINFVALTSRRDIEEEDEKDVLKDGDEVSVSVTPISVEMADYLTGLEQDSNGPAMWEGDFCLGYFLASPVAKKRIIYRPDEMKEFK